MLLKNNNQDLKNLLLLPKKYLINFYVRSLDDLSICCNNRLITAQIKLFVLKVFNIKNNKKISCYFISKHTPIDIWFFKNIPLSLQEGKGYWFEGHVEDKDGKLN